MFHMEHFSVCFFGKYSYIKREMHRVWCIPLFINIIPRSPP